MKEKGATNNKPVTPLFSLSPEIYFAVVAILKLRQSLF